MKNIKSLSISTGITGHHWTTKGVISFILFFGLYFLLVRTDDDLDVMKEVNFITILTIIATIILFGFYVWHFFA